jgi:hypothetical protein
MKHVGTITFGISWIKMGFNKIPSTPTAIPALAMVSIMSGLPPVTPAVWLLLQGVGYIQHRRCVVLHGWNSSKINNHVLSKHVPLSVTITFVLLQSNTF